MKSKKKRLGMGALILIVLCMSAAFMAAQGKTNYYTQIDNSGVKEIAPHGAMNYKYALVAYDANGRERDIEFETSRILTDGAYLCLRAAPIRGVVSWAEIQYGEMPEAVQAVYSEQ